MNIVDHGLTNKFSYNLPDLAFLFLSYLVMHKSTSQINKNTCEAVGFDCLIARKETLFEKKCDNSLNKFLVYLRRRLKSVMHTLSVVKFSHFGFDDKLITQNGPRFKEAKSRKFRGIFEENSQEK